MFYYQWTPYIQSYPEHIVTGGMTIKYDVHKIISCLFFFKKKSISASNGVLSGNRCRCFSYIKIHIEFYTCVNILSKRLKG